MRHLLSKIPLRAAIVLPFVTQLSITVSLITWLSARNGQQAVNDVANQLWEETTLHVVDNVTQFMDVPQRLATDTATFLELDVANLQDPEILIRYLWHQMRSHEHLFIMAIGFENGTVAAVGTEGDDRQLVVRQMEPGQTQLHTYEIVGEGNRGALLRAEDFDVKGRPWYRQAVEAGQTTWTNIYPNYAFPYLLISVVKPIYEPNTGELIGVTNPTISLRGIDEFLNSLNVSPSGEVFIIERSGLLVASSTQENLYQEALGNDSESNGRLSALNSSSARVRRATRYLIQHFGDLRQIRKRELLYFSPESNSNASNQLRQRFTTVFTQESPEIVQVTPFSDPYGLDWLVVVAVPEADFMQRIYANTRLTWTLCFAAFVLATLSGIAMSRWITRPLIELNQRTKTIATQGLADGLVDETASSKGTREVRELAHSFGQMVDRLQRSFSQMQVLNRSLSESESRFQQLLEALPVGTAVHDHSGKLIYLNRVGRDLLQVTQTPEISSDQMAVAFQIYHAETQEPYSLSEMPALRALKGETVYADDLELRQPNRVLPIEVWASPIYNDQNQVTFSVAAFQDISDRKRTEEQLIHNALHDSLTDLPNRTLLLQRLRLALRRTQQTEDYSFAVLFLDLDRFKVVNDSLGHLVGDQLLISTAYKIQQVIQPTDLAARLGGDEFVVLLENIENVQTVLRKAEAIFTELQKPVSIEGRELVTSTSMGIVLNTAAYQDAHDVLRDADIALYRAKAKGRGRYEVFDAEMHTQALKRLQLENDLRQAITSQQLRLYYQPIFAIDNMTWIGLEALVRWAHPTQGLVSPVDFIPVAEETGLIKEIDAWVLQNACEQLANWHQQFPQHQHLKISVNLSGPEFQEDRLVEGVLAALNRTGLAANNLTLEITENTLVENVDRAIKVLQTLREQGIRISVDDFGTGYSSLSYLYNLPLDYLKIDKSFVGDMQLDGKNYKIVEAIISLSNQLSLEAVAEGIETPQQLAWLAAMGCELGQGYLVSHPQAAEEVTHLLQQQTR